MDITLPTGERIFMTPEQKANAIKWYRARDTLFGDNGVQQNVALGVQLAKELVTNSENRHIPTPLIDDAVWVVNNIDPDDYSWNTIIHHRHPSSPTSLLLRRKDDPRAQFFGARLHKSLGKFASDEHFEDDYYLSRSATLGYAPARFYLGVSYISLLNDPTIRLLATQDRTGLDVLGDFYRGSVLENDKLALALHKESSDLGDEGAFAAFACLIFDASNPKRYELLGKVAKRVREATSMMFRTLFVLNSLCIFEIGTVCKREDLTWRNRDSFSIFGETFSLGCDKGNAIRVICKMYQKCRYDARIAIGCWIWIARQLGVVKDIRGVIAIELWRNKREWFEKFDHFSDAYDVWNKRKTFKKMQH